MGFNQIKVELCSSWGADKNIAHAAWASSTDKEKLEAKSEMDVARVVTGVVNNHHDTPKERLWLEFFITCPIFIERQFDKYRLTLQYQQFDVDYKPSFLDKVKDFLIKFNRQLPMVSWAVGAIGRWIITQNELSGRYRTIPDRPYETPIDVAKIMDRADPELSSIYHALEWDEVLRQQHEIYQAKLNILKNAEKLGHITNAEYKRAREVLRGILGTAYLTDMRMVMNMNAFEHIINQRLAKDAQLESRYVAYLMIKQLQASSIANVLLAEMIKANGWAPLMADMETYL
jgi:thymidylate synthase ThyX